MKVGKFNSCRTVEDQIQPENVGFFVRVPVSLQTGFVFDGIGKILLIGFACGLIRLRGETLVNIGLKRPASWMRRLMMAWGWPQLFL